MSIKKFINVNKYPHKNVEYWYYSNCSLELELAQNSSLKLFLSKLNIKSIYDVPFQRCYHRYITLDKMWPILPYSICEMTSKFIDVNLIVKTQLILQSLIYKTSKYDIFVWHIWFNIPMAIYTPYIMNNEIKYVTEADLGLLQHSRWSALW